MIVVNPTGGGLSNGKLAQATATPADVLSGKTFFAGGKDIKTGTFNLAAANATAAQVAKGYTFYAGDSTLKTGTLVVPSGTYRLSAGRIDTPNIYSSGSVNCGFRPTHLALWRGDPTDGIAIIYDVNSSAGNDGNIDYWSVTITITNSGFKYEDLYNRSEYCNYFAFGK